MKKRLVVAGCRDYNNYQEAKSFIDSLIINVRKNNEIVVVSGGCKGADMLGERYAKDNGFEIERHEADWDRYGRFAGPRRNEEMAEVADFVICFWDGKSRGTRSMIECANAKGKPLRIKLIYK